MSHIVEAKTSIQSPDLALLTQAVHLVASQHQGTLENYYVDYYGRRHSVSTKLALHTPELIRGIGIEVADTGELAFVGDPWAVRQMFEQVQSEIVQTYVSLATMQALSQLGYTPEAQEAEDGSLVIAGVSYA